MRGLIYRLWDWLFGPPAWFREAEAEGRRFREEFRASQSRGCRRLDPPRL